MTDIPVTSYEIMTFVASILKNGVDVRTKNRSQELRLLHDISSYVNKKTKFSAYVENDIITIETPYYDPLMIVDVDNSIMSLIPVTDYDYFDVLKTVIEFVISKELSNNKKVPKKPKYVVKDDEFDWI